MLAYAHSGAKRSRANERSIGPLARFIDHENAGPICSISPPAPDAETAKVNCLRRGALTHGAAAICALGKIRTKITLQPIDYTPYDTNFTHDVGVVPRHPLISLEPARVRNQEYFH